MEVVEELKGAFKADFWTGKVLPIGVGAVIADRLGDKVADVLPQSLKTRLGGYVDAFSEVVVGLGVTAAAGVVPHGWKETVRTAGAAGIGLGVFHALSELMEKAKGSSKCMTLPPARELPPATESSHVQRPGYF